MQWSVSCLEKLFRNGTGSEMELTEWIAFCFGFCESELGVVPYWDVYDSGYWAGLGF